MLARKFPTSGLWETSKSYRVEKAALLILLGIIQNIAYTQTTYLGWLEWVVRGEVNSN